MPRLDGFRCDECRVTYADTIPRFALHLRELPPRRGYDLPQFVDRDYTFCSENCLRSFFLEWPK